MHVQPIKKEQILTFQVKIPATENDYPDARPVKIEKKLKLPGGIKMFDNWDPDTTSDDAINEEELLPITQADLDSHARKVRSFCLFH